MILLWIIASTFIVSAVSLAGIVTLAIKKDLLAKILFGLVGFSAGAMLGGAFLHILPEAMEKNPHPEEVFSLLIAGIVLFFCWKSIFTGGIATSRNAGCTPLPT
jgi:zinc and cadmium transporter